MKASRIFRFKQGVAPFVLGVALLSPSLHAQEDISSNSNENISSDAIVVTGSRIARPNFDSVQPTLLLGEEQLEDRGFTNVADAINEIPAFGLSDANGTDAQGISGVGQNFVNFFGLGSQRTLTVVNGRRFVAANAPSVFNAAGGLQVDLNVIPVGLIERVETIAVTGAPVYGSDAIAGTVNVILKRDYEGAELTSSYGISQRGDMDEFLVRGLVGGNFADGRGNVALSFEYNKRGGLIESDRKPYRDSYSFQTNPENGDSSDGIPDRVLIKNARVSFANFNGLPSFGFGNPFIGVPVSGNGADILQFDNNGNLVPYDPGTQYGLVFSSGGDGVNLAELGNLVTPSKRFLINGLGRFEVTPGVEAYTELFYANTRASEQISQAVWNTDFFSGTSGALAFSVNNPFLTPEARATIQSNCDELNMADCQFLLSRSGRSIASGDNQTTQNLYRIVGGIRGDFNVGGRDLNYDVSLNYGRTENTSVSDGISDRRMSFALDALALDATQIGAFDPTETLNIVRNGAVLMDVAAPNLQVGDIACAVEVNRPTPPWNSEDLAVDIDNCVPLNYFGEDNTSPEARAYVNVPFGSTSYIEQKVFDANVNGSLFDLPAGPLGFSVGYQHRVEEAAFRPDAAYQMGIGRSAPITGTAGRFSTNEFAGELRIPLLEAGMIPVVSSLVAEGAARHVDNSRAGSDWTYTAGGTLGLFADQLRFRGNYTKSIRSPALVEQFLPVSTTFSRANDPCDASNVNGGPNPETRKANCQADALAHGLTQAEFDNFQSVVISGTRQGSTGGNVDLRNERASSYTIGAVIQPRFVPRLSVAVDYVNISIRDAISNLALVDVMNACYDSPDFPNDFCGRFSRGDASDPNGAFQVVDGFRTGYVNAGSQDFEAITAQMSYSLDMADVFGGNGDLGQLSFDGSLFRLLTDERSVTGFDFDDRVGQVARSKWRGQLNLTYKRDDVSLLWQTRYIGSAIFDNDDSPESRDLLGIGDYWLFNAGVAFQPSENLEVQFNINNVFDVEAPYGAYASSGSYAYDYIGRYFRAGASLRF